jgi:hypothetical protein
VKGLRGRGSGRLLFLAIALGGSGEVCAEHDPYRKVTSDRELALVETRILKVEVANPHRSDVRLQFRNMSKHALGVIEIRLRDRATGSILTNMFSFKEVPAGGVGELRLERASLPNGLVFDSLRHEVVIACAASHPDLCRE